MSINQRILQFRQMAEADPENELGHFSLGKALLEAGEFPDAVGPLTRALQLNPTLSKAYQLLGDAYEKSGQRPRAVETLSRGVTTADEQGDRVPRDAMMRMLRDMDAPVPTLKQGEGAVNADLSGVQSSDGFKCSRCGRPHGQLEKRPFKGDLGEKVHAHVCASCWREWISMGTKVINELGLVMSSRSGQDSYDQYMVEFLQLEDR
jgi:Fe-S cluster biosynthesis and repair protein YggX